MFCCTRAANIAHPRSKLEFRSHIRQFDVNVCAHAQRFGPIFEKKSSSCWTSCKAEFREVCRFRVKTAEFASRFGRSPPQNSGNSTTSDAELPDSSRKSNVLPLQFAKLTNSLEGAQILARWLLGSGVWALTVRGLGSQVCGSGSGKRLRKAFAEGFSPGKWLRKAVAVAFSGGL